MSSDVADNLEESRKKTNPAGQHHSSEGAHPEHFYTVRKMSSLPWKSVEEENAKAEDVAGFQDGDRQEGEKEAVLKEASQKGHDANVPR